jgi:septal ring factor EnvC (AmiA/AmiB activator)
MLWSVILLFLIAIAILSLALVSFKNRSDSSAETESNSNSKVTELDAQVNKLNDELRESKEKYNKLASAVRQTEPLHTELNNNIKRDCGINRYLPSIDELKKQHELPVEKQSNEYKAEQKWLACVDAIDESAIENFLLEYGI